LKERCAAALHEHRSGTKKAEQNTMQTNDLDYVRFRTKVPIFLKTLLGSVQAAAIPRSTLPPTQPCREERRPAAAFPFIVI